ncbi:MAG: hypothetical protein Q9M36_02525 [Sulfurovum sp.]|nr:hypothetical protein [Sulfurovum sp.]
MSKIEFDEFGNPKPYEIIALSMEECENIFVKNFPDSDTRIDNWDGLKRFNHDLKTVLKYPLRQWIDGSFVTNKLNPNDIDLVSFIHQLDFVPSLSLFDMNRSDGYPKKQYNIDGYVIINLPESHQYYVKMQEQTNYWKEFFSTDREGNPKSIVEIVS